MLGWALHRLPGSPTCGYLGWVAVRPWPSGAEAIASESALHAGDLDSDCPNPGLAARKRVHFGRTVDYFECPRAVEVYIRDRGIVIRCAGRDTNCGVDNGATFFVGSPDINPLKGFLETTLSYLGLK